MKTTLLRAGALSCALLASTALVTPAQAQSLPRFNQVDDNGVDLVTGDYFFSLTEGSIGSGEGALTLVRNWAGAAGWTDNWTGKLAISSSEAIVEFGTYADTFTNSSGTFTSTKADGASLVAITNGYRYTARDGTQVDYRTEPVSGEQLLVPGCAGGSTCGIPVSMRRPSGMTYTMQYDFILVCTEVQDGACNHYADSYRWHGVSNSANYAFAINYATDDPGNGDLDPTAVAAWYRRSGATFTNLDGAPASPPTVTYSAVSATVLDVTDSGGETWRLTNNLGTGLVGIRRPGAGSDTTTISYSSGRVSSVTNEGVTTSYAFSTSGASRNAVITDANSQVTTVVSDITAGRITSVTDPLSRTTSYTLDSNSRLTRVTAPEGNYVNYTYDGRGNVTEARAVAKSGSALSDVVTTASYDASCSNPVTCNQPNSATDARGFRTDYTYDGTHGGVLTVTQPAASGNTPVGSGDRPQTRYSYTQITAVTGQPVYMLTGVSACASGTAGGSPSCVGTANESRQVIAYDTDNLRTTSVTARNGDNSLSATNAFTYDAIGNTLTVDGPLSGSADTTRYRYDAARRVVGVVGPDPDGGGSLKHRAVRATYTNGLPTRVEQGTVNSQSDGDWAAFSALQKVEQDYDANARPTVQRLMSGSTTYQLTQTSYDSLGRLRCTAQRMNPAEFASLPSDACTLDTQGSFGPDRITRTTYDNAGQMTKVETGYGVSGEAADEMTATYRSNGQVETVTDANGNRTTYVYDGHDRLSRTRMPDPSTPGTSSATDYEELTYATAAGGTLSTPLVSSRRLRDTTSIAFTYDNLGRLTGKDLPGSTPDRTYVYDLLGRMTSAAYTGFTTGMTWDALGRRLTDTNTGRGTITSTWDAAGRRTRIDYGGGFYVDYDYNLAGDTTTVRENGATSGPGVLATYAWDDLGRRTSLTRGNGTVTGYSYDAVSRLSGLSQNLNGTGYDVTFAYTHNPAGEIATTTRSNDAYAYTGHANANTATSVNGLNQVTAIGAASVSHTDNRGNVTAIGATTYTYDPENRLTNSSSGALNAYDPLGRPYYAGGGAGGVYLQPDGDRFVTEHGTGGAGLLRRYVFGEGLDEPLTWYEGTGTSDRRWFHADERGSVIAVSDGSGDLVTAVNRYDEYGVPQGTLTGRFGYTGQVWLPDAGLYHYRARAYNPAMGRFMQTDPIGYDGGMNLYAYVGNNPVNFADPMGLTQQEVVVTYRRPQNPGIPNFGIPGSPSLGSQEPDFPSRLEDRQPDCDPSAEEDCALVNGRRQRRRPFNMLLLSSNGFLAQLAEMLRPPEGRRRGETYWQCVGRISGADDLALALVGAFSIAAGAPGLGYPRVPLAGGGRGTSLISAAARSIPRTPTGTRRFGTGNLGGQVGRGLSRVSVGGGAAAVGWSVGAFLGALQRCGE